MPAAVVKALAKKSGKTPAAVEQLWSEIKKDVEKEYPKVSGKSPRYYALVVGILKKRLKIR